MAGINTALYTPTDWLHLAPNAPSATDLVLATDSEVSFRLVQIGKILGPITLVDHHGDEQTFSLAAIQNMSGQLLGQWTKIKGASLCYDFHCGR